MFLFSFLYRLRRNVVAVFCCCSNYNSNSKLYFEFFRSRETTELRNPKVRRVEKLPHTSNSSKDIPRVKTERNNNNKPRTSGDPSYRSSATTRELRKRKPEPEVAFPVVTGKDSRSLNSSSESEEEFGKTDRAKKPLSSAVPSKEESASFASGTSTKTSSKPSKSCAGLPASSSSASATGGGSSGRHSSRYATSHSTNLSNYRAPKLNKSKPKTTTVPNATAPSTTSEEETKAESAPK